MPEFRFGNIPPKKDIPSQNERDLQKPKIKTIPKPESESKRRTFRTLADAKKNTDQNKRSVDRPRFKTLDEKPLSRRTFMKAAAAAIVLAAGAERLSKMTGKLSDALIPSPEEIAKETSDPSAKLDEIRLNLRLETLEQARIKEMDDMIAGRTLEKQIETKGRITLNGATRQSIYSDWRKEYVPGGYNYRYGIVDGLKRMEPWKENIRMIFREHGVPEKFMYLAFAESNFIFKAVSGKEAVGPYQILAHIARKYGLIVSENYDERLDPLKSADLCTRYLKDSYQRYGNDWDLSILSYNGGFTGDYLEHVKHREKSEPLKITGLDIVNQGDTLENLAKKHGTSVTLLMRANPKIKKPNDLQADSYIKISHKRNISLGDFKSWLEGQANKEIDAAKKSGKNPKYELKQYSENINYPEKFYAIYDIMEENGLLSKEKSPKSFEILEIKKGASLEYISKLKGFKLSELQALNPAVINSKGTLPRGTQIRLPKA